MQVLLPAPIFQCIFGFTQRCGSTWLERKHVFIVIQHCLTIKSVSKGRSIVGSRWGESGLGKPQKYIHLLIRGESIRVDGPLPGCNPGPSGMRFDSIVQEAQVPRSTWMCESGLPRPTNFNFAAIAFMPRGCQLGELEIEKATKCCFFPTNAWPWMARLGVKNSGRLRQGWQAKKFKMQR